MSKTIELTREAKSKLDFKVSKDQTICEFTYLISPTGILSEKIPPTQFKSMVMVAYGELTAGFEIGDAVVISQNVQNLAPLLVDIPSNKMSLAATRRMFELLTKEEIQGLSKSGYKVKLVDYFAIPAYEIVSYIPQDTEDAKFITSLSGSKVFSREDAVARFELTPKSTDIE